MAKPMPACLPALFLTERNLERLGVRQWGWPTGCFEGKAWRTAFALDGSWLPMPRGPCASMRWMVTALLPIPDDLDNLRVERWEAMVIEDGAPQLVPKHLLDAMQLYADRFDGPTFRL